MEGILRVLTDSTRRGRESLERLGKASVQHARHSPATLWRKVSRVLLIAVLVVIVLFSIHSWSPGDGSAVGWVTTGTGDAEQRGSKAQPPQEPTPVAEDQQQESELADDDEPPLDYSDSGPMFASSTAEVPDPTSSSTESTSPRPTSHKSTSSRSTSTKPMSSVAMSTLKSTASQTTPSQSPSPKSDTETTDHSPNPPSSPVPHQDRRMVVLAPATKGDPNLCKFMVSAIALGYPSPIIVNWGRDPFEMSKWEGGPNLSKISGIMRYLDAVLHEEAHPDDALHEADVVVIADGFDIWFQLPPEVLLKRYHQINDRANDRLAKQWRYEEKMPMRQTIVLACAKRCWPTIEDGSNLHCDELPESPLPADIYGPDTDVPNPESFQKMRPRYINGGVYMGTAGDMRRMFRRAYDKVDGETSKGVHLFSEQGITGEVLGEQETWRNWRRKYELGNNSNATDLMERDFEYHVGLDYLRELSYATVHSEPDGDIVALGNKSGIAKYSADLGISPVRVKGVPKDIKKTPNPLRGLPNSTLWEEMPLYVDFYTNKVPALLHHNAWIQGMKKRREWWWDRTWFFPYLRPLLARQLKPGKLRPLAEVRSETRNITYWAPKSDTHWRRPRLLVDKAVEPLKEIQFDDVCRRPDEYIYAEKHWWDEVFRDGLGPI